MVWVDSLWCADYLTVLFRLFQARKSFYRDKRSFPNNTCPSHISPRLNAELLEQKYEQWSADPRSVEENWAAFFEGFELGATVPKKGGTKGVPAVGDDSARLDQPLSEEQLSFRGKIVSLVYNYRTLGHTQAHINPLQDSEAR